MALKNKLGPITAVVISIALASWLLIGGDGITTAQHPTSGTPPTPHSNETTKQPTSTPSTTKKAHSVQVKTIHAQLINLHLTLSGQTQASETLDLQNLYAGKVTTLYVKKGDSIKAGEPILQIDQRTLKAQLDEAKLLVTQRRLELDGITDLNRSNLTSRVKLAEAKTALGTAKTNLQRYQVELENTTVTAPFSGVINTLAIKQAQQLGKDAPIGTLLALNPLRISVPIPQDNIQQIRLGTKGLIQLANGQQKTGSVTYISASANQESRSIDVELTLDNPNNTIPAGITAEVDFALSQQRAHALSAALLTLNDAGHTAVKALDQDNKVKLMAVTPVKSERDKMWVKGLPDTVTLITVGQGFVEAGDTVSPHQALPNNSTMTPKTSTP